MPDNSDSEVEQNRPLRSETLDAESRRLIEDIAILVVRQFRRDERARFSKALNPHKLTEEESEDPNLTS